MRDLWLRRRRKRRGRKLSDPQRVLDGEGGWGCFSLLPGFCWAAPGLARRTGVMEKGGREWASRWWGGGDSRGERKINIWSGKWDRRRGGGERERATRLSGDQSIGRFSPCFFVNSSAFFKNFLRSFEYSSARSALRGCSGWGSFTSAMRDWITARDSQEIKLDMDNAFPNKNMASVLVERAGAAHAKRVH